MNGCSHNRLQRVWYAPAFSSLLESRRELAVIAGVGVLHLGLSLAGVQAWSCPIRALTGMPCPGCGLTTGTIQLLRGDIAASLQTHMFAPISILVLLVMFLVLATPTVIHKRIISFIKVLETRNGLTAWVLLSLVFYWGARLMGYPPFPGAY